MRRKRIRTPEAGDFIQKSSVLYLKNLDCPSLPGHEGIGEPSDTIVRHCSAGSPGLWGLHDWESALLVDNLQS